MVPAVLFCPLGPSLLTARLAREFCAPGTSSRYAHPTLSCFYCLIRSFFNCTPCSLVSVGRVTAGFLTMPHHPGVTFPADEVYYDYGDVSDDEEDLSQANGAPASENVGLPLKRSLRSVFNASQDIEAELYANVMERWTANEAGCPGGAGEIPSRKRAFEVIEDDSVSRSQRRKPASE